MSYTLPAVSNQKLTNQKKACILQAKIISPEGRLTNLYNYIDNPGISKLIVDGVEIPLSEAQRDSSSPNIAFFNLTPGQHDVQYYIKPWPWNGDLKGKLAIGGEHFSGVPIRQITFPDNLEIISGGTFSYPFDQETLEIPASVKEIRSGAFSGINSNVIIHTIDKLKIGSGFCSSSLSAPINGSLTFLGTGDIEVTPGNRDPINGNLTFDRQNITFNNVFGPVNGEEINFGQGNIIFEASTGGAFSGSSTLKRIIFGDGDVIMRNNGGRFCGNSALETITFGNGNIEIDGGNFTSNSSLKKIDFGKTGNLTIGGGDFNSCSVLEEIRFPNGLTTFTGSGNFTGSSLLKSVYIPNLKVTVASTVIPFNVPTDLEIGSADILGGSYSAFATVKNLIIHKGKIGPSAFVGNPLQSLTLGEVEIGNGAFAGTGIADGYECKLSNSITSMGQNAFSGAKLTKINIPTSLKEIPSGCFSGTYLTEIEIPPSIKIINASAFRDTPLGKLMLHNGLKRIETYAFNNTKIFDLVIPETVEYIGTYAFCNGASSTNYYLTNLTINMKKGKIDDYAFFFCYKLRNLKINPGLEELGNSVFYQAFDLINIHIPGTVKKIGNSCFYSFGYQRSDYKQITLEEGIERLEQSAFLSGHIYKDLILPNSIKYLGNSCLPNTSGEARIITYNPNPPERTGSFTIIYVPTHLCTKYRNKGHYVYSL